MRLIIALLLCGLCGPTYAAEPRPAEVPPPPQLGASSPDDDLEPQVTITKHTEQTVEEYRMGGRLYMIKITPRIGNPYYLVDDLGDGKFSRQESLDSGVRPPRWIIRNF